MQSTGTDTNTGGGSTDTTPPVIAEVTPITTPTTDTTPDYTFSSSEAGTITYGGSCATAGSATTNAIVGHNLIIFNTLSSGTYSYCTITVTDSAGNVSNTLTITSFIVDSTDTDGDGVGNNSDTDDDNDGISDADELAYGSDPLDNSSLPTNDRWSSSIKGANIVLSNYNLDASSQNTNFSWNSVYGEKSYSVDDGGIIEWKIQVISVDDDNNDSWEMVIGVGGFTEGDANSYNENNFLSYQTKGFGYIQEDGKKTSGSGSLSFLSAYELNDNITVRLDLNYDRLSFYKNTGDIRLSHFSLPSDSGKKYRLAASIGDDGDKFRIISHTTNTCVPPPSWLSGSVQSQNCSGTHDACNSKQWEGNWEITCGGGGERKCRYTNLTCGTGDCSVSVSGSGHDAYQNSVVFAENIISGNEFTLSCDATGGRGCRDIDIWCPTATNTTCSCTGGCSQVTMHCPQTGGSCTKSGSEQTKDNISATVFCQ
ncbi:MAG: thrombospondin type 3 repeat-containing protein [Candidatus Marinimicrobia bacterium]|nr:thrombospondin type 3 repeat-containing protein [Candidatus Neomarinimicrobiota bacterium]